jgi:hypothetical protein
MRRAAGRVGCGGGPARAGPQLVSPPAGLLEPQVLQEGVHRHQRMTVQPGPGAALEVVEARLLLQLLVGLLADPAGLDRRRQLVERGVGRRVGEVVLLLARAAPFAHQPDLVPGQVPAVAELCTLRRAHPHGAELRRELSLGPLPPADPVPVGTRQHGFGRRRGFARHGTPAWPPGGGRRPAQLDRGRVDVPGLRDPRCPGEAALARALEEGRPHTAPSVGQGTAEAHAGGDGPVDLRQGDLGLGRGVAVFFRHARIGAAHPGPGRARPGPGSSPVRPGPRSTGGRRRPSAGPSWARRCRRSPARRSGRRQGCPPSRPGPLARARHPRPGWR